MGNLADADIAWLKANLPAACWEEPHADALLAYADILDAVDAILAATKTSDDKAVQDQLLIVRAAVAQLEAVAAEAAAC